MKIVAWLLAILGVIAGGYQYWLTVMHAETAPQQAAGSAMALVWIIGPYCLARAITELDSQIG